MNLDIGGCILNKREFIEQVKHYSSEYLKTRDADFRYEEYKTEWGYAFCELEHFLEWLEEIKERHIVCPECQMAMREEEMIYSEQLPSLEDKSLNNIIEAYSCPNCGARLTEN